MPFGLLSVETRHRHDLTSALQSVTRHVVPAFTYPLQDLMFPLVVPFHWHPRS